MFEAVDRALICALVSVNTVKSAELEVVPSAPAFASGAADVDGARSVKLGFEI